MSTTQMQQLLDAFEALPLEDQPQLADIGSKRLKERQMKRYSKAPMKFVSRSAKGKQS